MALKTKAKIASIGEALGKKSAEFTFQDPPMIDDGAGGVKVDLPTVRAMKLEEIRAKRDAMLKKSDERFVEELSKAADTSAIEADKQALRDLMATAETDLSSKIKDTTIDAYDAFSGLTLSESYE